jgi:hypothetical protein
MVARGIEEDEARLRAAIVQAFRKRADALTATVVWFAWFDS